MPIPKLDERDQLAILQTITGCSVTQRIKTVKQPRGGFLNPNLFEETVLDSPDDLAPVENIHASLVGLAVDYLTRFMTGSPVDEAFEILQRRQARQANRYRPSASLPDKRLG